MFFDPAGVRVTRPPYSGRGSVVIAVSDSKPKLKRDFSSRAETRVLLVSGLARWRDGVTFHEHVGHKVIDGLVNVPILRPADLVQQ